MKKIILLLLVCGAFISASAQTTTTTTRTTYYHRHYYYYPSSNIYYDEGSGNYWYWDNASSKWIMTANLPSTITVVQNDRQPILYKGDDPWRNNAADIKKYKVKKNGRVKVKYRNRDDDE